MWFYIWPAFLPQKGSGLLTHSTSQEQDLKVCFLIFFFLSNLEISSTYRHFTIRTSRLAMSIPGHAHNISLCPIYLLLFVICVYIYIYTNDTHTHTHTHTYTHTDTHPYICLCFFYFLIMFWGYSMPRIPIMMSCR